MSKETEMRERTKESKAKESNTLSLTPAGAHTPTPTREGAAPAVETAAPDNPLAGLTREELQRIARTRPTVEQVISFAKSILGFNDEHFCREWYRQMSMAFWCDEFGNLIRNWGWVFNKWRLNKDLFERLRDPERIPDARKGGAKRKSDNWRGTNPKEVGNVLG